MTKPTDYADASTKMKINQMMTDENLASSKTTSLPDKLNKLLSKKRKPVASIPAPVKASSKPAEIEEEEEVIDKPKLPVSTKSWESLGLVKPLLRAVADMGFTHPTVVQEMTVPIITSGRDVLASSITGSGKTASFLLPLIQKFYKVKYNNALGNYTK